MIVVGAGADVFFYLWHIHMETVTHTFTHSRMHTFIEHVYELVTICHPIY